MYGRILVELLDKLAKLDNRPLVIVETGTMYHTVLEAGETNLEQRSTFAIARWIKGSGVHHAFHSIDFSSGHIETCKRVLHENKLDGIVRHHLSDAAEILQGIAVDKLFPIDFAILDTAIEPEITLAEYFAILPIISTPGIIVIDDTFVRVGAKAVNKGRLALPESEKQGLRNWTRIKTFGSQKGETMAAIALGPEAEKILETTPGWFESTGMPQR